MAPQRLASNEAAARWLQAQGATRLVADSRGVRAGDAFVAWPGHASDGRRFVGAALAAGASACLVEAEGAEAALAEGIDATGVDSRAESDEASHVASLRGLKAAAGLVADRFLGMPSDRLDVIAVTGTNGKTSSTWWIAQALSRLGRRCGLVGTLGIGEPNGAVVSTGLTTPDPITLQSALRDFADRDFAACAIEASSIGLAEHRLAGTRVAVAVFTNFTLDHLDYHGDMATYWAAKAQLFAWPGLRAAVVNVDDTRGADLATALAAGGIDLWTIGVQQSARLTATDLQADVDGLGFTVREGERAVALRTTLLGDYNAANLLGVVATLRALGVELDAAVRTCTGLAAVPGRMQRVVVDRVDAVAVPALPAVVVDYAHTPDALEKALAALAPLAARRGGQVCCVFGCGGDRDPGKRPLMGAIARRLAQRVVVTSDNPRREPPAHILAQILAGIVGHDEVDVIEDRAAAIRHAVLGAAAADIVMVAGKGHEDYQDSGGVKQPFSDVEQAMAALRERAAQAIVVTTRTATAARVAPVSMTVSTTATTAMMTLADAAALLPQARLVGDPATPIARLHSDTRSARAGDLFVALRGERFDANDFLLAARAAGVTAALAERGLAVAGMSGLEVDDARRAFGELARGWRRRFTMPLVAVTGSNGKTTVTQMIAAIFRAWVGPRALATEGSFNNDVGVPLTLLRMGAGGTEPPLAAVLELGMNHPGEIAHLAALVAPTVALVNNAQREHLEFMGSVDAVARENGAVIEALPPTGVAVFPAADSHTAGWRALAGARRVITFGAAESDADVIGNATWGGDAWQIAVRTPPGELVVSLHVPGRHNVDNALAAVACAVAAGCPLAAISAGLNDFSAVKGRSQRRRLVRGGTAVTLVDDTYNANPDSMRAAIDVLAALPAPRWLLVGDMGEVGSDGPAFHREVGAYAQERGIESLWAAGTLSEDTARAFAGARWFADVPALVDAVQAAFTATPLPAFASVLVKGSRFVRMERAVDAMLALGDAAGSTDAA